MTSIRRQLLAWLLSALALAGAMAGIALYFNAREDVNEIFDYQLKQVALALSHQKSFPTSPGQGPWDEEEENDFVLQAWSKEGTLIYDSRPSVVFPLHSGQGFSTVSWRDERWRLYVLNARDRIVQVAQPLAAREEMAAEIAFGILTPMLVLVPVLGLIIWIAVGRGLGPLNRIARAVGERNPQALEPLSEQRLPQEVQPLVHEINSLLERLGSALEAQRQFVADAAHELRTPLTAVQLQAQILERAPSPEDRAEALEQLKAGLKRAGHLVQQLLTMARLEPEALQPPAFSRVDLARLAWEVVAEYAPLAEDKIIDLGLSREERVEMTGDAASLRILISNLVDNAIRYTPSGGKVDVSVGAEGASAFLVVEDTGPGIPEEERPRVFDRFYRGLGEGAPGSGLGLAIVKRVADLHRATIALGTGGNGIGLKVSVRFTVGWAVSAG